MSAQSLFDKIVTNDRFLVASQKVQNGIPAVIGFTALIGIGKLFVAPSHLLEVTTHTAVVGFASVGTIFICGLFNKEARNQLNAFRSENRSEELPSSTLASKIDAKREQPSEKPRSFRP